MWIWNTSTVLSSASQISALITGAQAAGVTDLYLYMSPSSYSSVKTSLQSLIQSATAAGLRVWGLDGDRAYFADAKGPANFYAGINNLIAYNNAVAANARFFGFQADNEPQDDSGYTSFHSGIEDSALKTTAGSGVWQSTQAQDREMLMRSWLTIHQTAQQLLHAHGLRFGAAMPFWTESYYGGEVQVSFPTSANTHQGVMKYMMTLLDDYVIMSYNTNPSNAASRVAAQAAYASTLPAASQPRVYGSMELTAGVGANISYADTPGKNSKAVVMADMKTIIGILSQYPAFKGMAIEQWSSLEVMPN
jgi:hypothetical protein